MPKKKQQEEQDQRQTRRFVCEDCGSIEFDITVEPNYPLDEGKAQWLRDCTICPQCGGDIIEI